MFGDLGSLVDSLGRWARRFQGFLLRVAGVFLTAWCLLTFFPLRASEWWPPGWVSWVGDSASGRLLRLLEARLLPPGERLLVLSPFDPLTVLMGIGAGLALLVTIPYTVSRVLAFASSGLKPVERRAVRWLLMGVPALFVAGSALGFWLLPYVFQWCEALAGAAGAQPTASLTQFVYTALVFAFGVGASFEIPAVCAGLGAIGVLRSAAMRRHWRGAAMGTLLLAFLISPGIFGGLVEIPMWAGFMGLYGLGYLLVKRVEAGRAARGASPDAAPV